MSRSDADEVAESITEAAPGATVRDAATGPGAREAGEREAAGRETFDDGDGTEAGLAAPRDRYRRLGLLGSGGMGEVALCTDLWVGREVARKTLHEPRAESPEARARFMQEMRVQGRLEHPAIVPVYDFGIDEDGRLYFTMRPVRGRTLKQVLEDLARGDEGTVAKYSRHKLLTAFVSVCLAVHYAHTRDVLHRDLKPSNIMLGDFGEVYVLDWGIAKVAARAAGAGGDGTQPGTLIGTPAYMAPEQLLRKRTIDARADLYALGVILFEVLAQQPLHQGRDTPQIIEATIGGLDTRPSGRAPEVPPELDAICVRATALDPAQRFGTALEMASVIERFLEGDRDLERRRAVAEEHAEKAAVAAARAMSPEVEADEAEAARAEAMGNVVRSLTFNPKQPAATRTLVQLLVHMPERLPAEAEKEMGNADFASRQQSTKMAVVTYLCWLGVLPVGLMMGVKSWLAFGLSAGLILVSLAAGLWVARTKRFASPFALYLLTGLSGVTAMSVCSWAGPFILLPTVAAVMTLFSVVGTTRRERPLMMGLGSLIILVPVGLELLGVVPPSYAFEGGEMRVLARGYLHSPFWTLGSLLYASITWILIPPLMLGRMRDALHRAQRELFLHAWHFRRLLADAPADGAAKARLPAPS